MRQTKIALPERGAEMLFGLRDENLRSLESLFGVSLSARGNELIVQGEDAAVETLEKIVAEFSEMVESGATLENGDLRDAFRQISEGSAKSLHDLLPRKPILVTPVRQVAPRSVNQLAYVQAIEKLDLVFGIGPAGTGKTYLAVAMAIAYLLTNRPQW